MGEPALDGATAVTYPTGETVFSNPRVVHATLPHSPDARVPGLNHDWAQTHGMPETITAVPRLFFEPQKT